MELRPTSEAKSRREMPSILCSSPSSQAPEPSRYPETAESNPVSFP
jgi:hypothetical protein